MRNCHVRTQADCVVVVRLYKHNIGLLRTHLVPDEISVTLHVEHLYVLKRMFNGKKNCDAAFRYGSSKDKQKSSPGNTMRPHVNQATSTTLELTSL